MDEFWENVFYILSKRFEAEQMEFETEEVEEHCQIGTEQCQMEPGTEGTESEIEEETK